MINKNKKTMFFKAIALYAFFAVTALSANTVSAQSFGETMEDEMEVEPIVSDFQHYYEDITRASLAKLYWRLDAFDVNDDDIVDNFMRLTECDIFKDYFFDEFQWEDIRQKARIYLRDNAKKFPTRYKFIQPLRLGDYDFKRQQFAVADDFKIDGITKYEIVASDKDERICSSPYREVEKYPAALIVTLSQPFTLVTIPMDPERALRYTKEKNKQFERLGAYKSKEYLHKYRDAYLIMKIRFFDYRGERFAQFANYNTAQANAVLEGYEIYSDREYTDLLYYKNYLRKEERRVPNKVKLKEQYEDMIRRRERSEQMAKERQEGQ